MDIGCLLSFLSSKIYQNLYKDYYDLKTLNFVENVD